MESQSPHWIEQILQLTGLSLSQIGAWYWVAITVILLFTGLLIEIVSRQFLLHVVRKIVAKTKAQWDDVLFDSKVTRRLCHVISPIVLLMMIPVLFAETWKGTHLLETFLKIYIVIVSVRLINALLHAIYNLANQNVELQGKPLKGLLQTGQVITYLVAVILLIAFIIDRSPVHLLTGLGASAAILILVFKDSIMGVVSGIQLSANNMLHVGDWITMSKYEVNGRVTEVTLNTVKVRNWDNTIVTVPPYLLISDSFQNWKAMQDSGGRRVMRALNIDMQSVKFCSPKMMLRFQKIKLLKEYLAEKFPDPILNPTDSKNDPDPLNQQRPTNLGVFRIYLEQYLAGLANVNQEMILMVRYKQASEKGLPIELYFFSRYTEWTAFERMQAEVLDHVIGIIPEFGLRVFQIPSGWNIQAIADETPSPNGLRKKYRR